MVMPRSSQSQDRPPQRSLGFFLQCNGDSDSASWSCNAVAELRLLPVKENTEMFSRSKLLMRVGEKSFWCYCLCLL